MSRPEPLADIIVLGPDLPDLRLVVEIKQGKFDFESVVARVKSYMQGYNCPLGLLVTPTRTWLLHDNYEEDGSLEQHEYPTATLLGISEVPDDARELEIIVGRWLESLTSGSSAGLREEVRSDVARYVIPAVIEGRVESGRFG